MDKTREEFEKWVDSQFVKELIGLGKDDKGVYLDLYARFMEQAFAAAKELYAPKWVGVEDRLPPPETPVLAIVNGFDGILTVERRWEVCNPHIEAYFEDFLYWDWVDNDGQDFCEKVVKWMPLPK